MSRIVPPRSFLRFTLALALLLPGMSARAESSAVHFVGIQRGCERDGQLDRAVERRLFQKGITVGLIRQPSGAPLPPCFGESCAQLFKQSCQTAGGRLLGGLLVQGKDTTKVRLWLHDLGTGQTAYQDEYCQSCEVVGTLATQAARLIASPKFGSAAGAAPQYCSQPSSGAAQAATGSLFLTVYGDGKNKGVLLAALKQQLGLLGRKVLPVPADIKTYGLESLQRIVSGQHNAQVLGAEVQKEGKVQIFLFDQQSGLSDGKTVDCGECEKDKDALVSRIQPEVSALLEHCFGDACGSNPAAPPPPEACEPFPDPTCGFADATAIPGASHSGRYIDPSTAKLVKGGLWGFFAASAATAVGLTIANYTGAGTSTGQNDHTVNLLGPAALATAGLAVLSLGIAIPITVQVRRAESSAQHLDRQPDVSKFQCPN